MDINSLHPRDIKEIIDKKIGKFFTSCNIPFNTVGSIFFIDLVQTLISIKPDKIYYRPPHRDRLSTTILNQLEVDSEKDKLSLLKDLYSVMMVDGWKNKVTNRKLLVFTLRTLKAYQLYLCSYDICLETEDTDTLSKLIKRAIKEAWDKYKTNVIAIITDNDSKIKAGAREATNTAGESLLQATCYSHSGNLLIKSFVDEDFAKQLRDVVNAYRDPKYDALIKRLKGVKLQNFPDTRFCFLRNTCASILSNIENKSLRTIYNLQEITLPDSIGELIISEDFKNKLKSTIRNLTPICKLINACQSPKKNIADGTELWLSLELPTHQYDETIDKRIKSAILDVGFAANYMHHEYRGYRLNATQTQTAERYLIDHLDEIGRAELTDYINNRNNRDDYAGYNPANPMDPIQYWTLQKCVTPKLADLCLKMMLIPASTAMLEGFFSHWTYVHNNYRNRLSHEKSATLVDLYYMSKHIENGIFVTNLKKSNKKKKEYMEID